MQPRHLKTCLKRKEETDRGSVGRFPPPLIPLEMEHDLDLISENTHLIHFFTRNSYDVQIHFLVVYLSIELFPLPKRSLAPSVILW